MLKNVHLKNLALIKEADIDFEKGLNILTGETGAGKSILIGSINIALGEKASKSFIRSGADAGLVELLFVSHDERISSLLAEYDLPADEGRIVITRKITPDGSISRINGSSVTLAVLRSVTSLLVDIHGQHDHQSLLNPAKHLDIVDEFGGASLQAVKEEFHDGYRQFKALRAKYRQFSQNPEELEKEKSLLQFECDEIEEAQLKSGEDSLLEAEYRKIAAAQSILSGLNKIRSGLFDQPDSALSRISDSLRELSYLKSLDPDLKGLEGYLLDLESIARDMNHELNGYLDSNPFSPERSAQVQKRLDLINRLKGKYGSSIEDILAYKETGLTRLKELEDYEAHKEELLSRMEQIRARVKKAAGQLSDARKASAQILEERIRSNLEDLNFLNVNFTIAFEKADKIYENGFDKAEFMISTNVGEPVKPLIRVASGGELSRVMLAIKASIADADHTDTLIFDEIDTGISGRTAQKVAEKLALLSLDHQLICITHLPQIAAMADTHFAIEKSVSEGSTISGIRKLSRPDSVLELARLLSGSEITESTLQNAEDMKKSAAALKEG